LRTPFQILVLPYRKTPSGPEYAILRRSDAEYWQFVAGGGEDTEKPLEAAKRETEEEIGIVKDVDYMPLDSQNTVPKDNFAAASSWNTDLYVIPEYCFAVDAESKEIVLSSEHIEYQWVNYDSAQEKLHWDSNKNALWELNERLKK
jgi:dATP pyrophosphohydrolase